MAAWLSSKLKVAEQLLHQIDQQAAESLRKPERSATQPSSLQQHLDREREHHARGSWTGGVRDSSLSATKHQPAQQRTLSGLRKPSLQPLSTHHEHPAAAARQDQDWTQLLGSPASSPGASSPFASSVGSCDPGSGRDLSRKSGPTPSSKAAQVSSLKQIAAQSSRLRQPANGKKSGTAVHAVNKNFRDESVKRRLDLEASGVSGEEQALQATVPEDAISGVDGGGLSWTDPDLRRRVGLGQDDAPSPHSLKTIVQQGDGIAEGEETGGGSGLGGGVQNVDTVGFEDVGQTLVGTEALERTSTGCADDVLDAALRRSTDGFSKYGVHHVASTIIAEDMNGFVDLELESSTAPGSQHPHPTEEFVAGFPAAGAKEQEEQTGVQGAPGRPGEGGAYDAIGAGAESLSGSESESGSETSDSEYEDEVRRKAATKRKLRKQRQLETLAIEGAKAAIKEREAFVQQLEIQKEALERALADGVEQQVKEAAELQLSMMEVAQAVELEKQQHSVTRMEGLAVEAQLEAENADLTRALAAAQRDLDEHLSRVSEINSRLEAKRDSCADLERKLASFHHRQRQRKLSEQIELPDEIERSYREQQVELSWKIQQRQSEVKELESNINNIMENVKRSTDLEVELQGRLNQLTDQLIQKQAQVEALATEKATLVFRLEAITNNLRDEKSAAMSRADKRASKGVLVESDYEDLEFGSLRAYSSKDKAWLREHEAAGRRGLPWMSFFQQIDYLFLGGARILRRHGAVRAVAGTYLLALHGWFLFVLFMKSHRDDLSLPLPAE